MPINRLKTPLRSRRGVVPSRSSFTVSSTTTRVTEKHFIDVTPVKSYLPEAGDLSPLSPGWVPGKLAVFKSPSPRKTRRSSVFRHLQSKKMDSVFKAPTGFPLKSPPGVKTRSRRSSVYFMNGETIIEKVVKHDNRPSSGRRKTMIQVSVMSEQPEKKLGRLSRNKEGKSSKKSPQKNQTTRAKKSSPAKQQTRSKQAEKSAICVSAKRKGNIPAEPDSPIKRTKRSSAEKTTFSPKRSAKKARGGSAAKKRVRSAVKQSPGAVSSTTTTPVKDGASELRRAKKSRKSTSKSTSEKKVKNRMSTREMAVLLDESLTLTRQPQSSAVRSSARKRPVMEKQSSPASNRKSVKRDRSSISPSGSPPLQSLKKRLSGQFVNSETPVQTPIISTTVLGKDGKISSSRKSSPVKTPGRRKSESEKKFSVSTPVINVKKTVTPSSVKLSKINISDEKKPKKSPKLSPTKTPKIKSLSDKSSKVSTPKSSVSKTSVTLSKSFSSRKSLSSKSLNADMSDISFDDLQKPRKSLSMSGKSEKQSASKLIKQTKSQSRLSGTKSPLKATRSPLKAKKTPLKSTKSPRQENKDGSGLSLRHRPHVDVPKKKIVIELKSFSDITPVTKVKTTVTPSSSKHSKINILDEKKYKKSPKLSPIKTPKIKSLSDKSSKVSTPKSSVSKTSVTLSKSFSSRKSLSSKSLNADMSDISFDDLQKPRKSLRMSRKSEKQSASKLLKQTKSQSRLSGTKSPLKAKKTPLKSTKSPRQENKDGSGLSLRHRPHVDVPKKKIVIELKSFSDITPISRLKLSSPAQHSTPKLSSRLLSLQQKHVEATARLQELKQSRGQSLQYRDKNIEKLKLSASETLLKGHADVIDSDMLSSVNTRSVASLSSRKRKQTMLSSTVESVSKRRRTELRRDSPLICSSTSQEQSAVCLKQGLKRHELGEGDQTDDSSLTYVRSVSVDLEQEEHEDFDRTTTRSRSWCTVM